MAHKAFFPPDVGGDIHVIRRLGWAVIHLWDDLPKDVQSKILSQANFTEDSYQTISLNEQIRAFVRKHTGAADASWT